MTTMIQVTTRQPGRILWNQVKQNLAAWQNLGRSRHDLMNLSDRCLQDIGLSRGTANFEAAKPFWMA